MAAGIDIGDAVLTFLGDTTQLDAAFDKVGTEGAAKLAPAETAVQGLGTQFQKTGEQGVQAGATLADAFKLLPPVVAASDAQLQNMAFSLRNVAVAAEDMGEKSALAAVRGGEKLKVLEEGFGIRLPRGINRFISELIPLGSIMDAAFAASVIFIVVEALAKAIEKVVELTHDAEETAKAMDALHAAQQKTFTDLEDNLIRAQIKTAELTGNHLEAMRLKLQLIDNTSLAKLRSELEKLGQEADKDFEKFNRSWFSQAFLGLEGGEGAIQKLDEVGKAVDKALSARTPEAFGNAIKLVDTAIGETDKKLGELTEQQKKFDESQKNMFAGRGSSRLVTAEPIDPKTIQSYKEASLQLQEFKKDVEEAQKAEQAEKDNAGIEEKNRQLADLNALEKASLQQRLAAIETEKNLQHQAFEDKKITAAQWAEAQTKATIDALKAETDYDAKVVENAKKESDVGKGTVAAKNAATDATGKLNKAFETAANGLDKAQQETAKLREEMEKLVFPVEKTKDQTQAFHELENAEKQLAQAQKNLEEAQITKDTKDQEAAIKKLASLRLISKRTEADALEKIEQEEKDRALAVLEQLLDGQLKELNAAKAKFSAAEKEMFPEAELAKFKTQLDQAQIAVDKTQTEMLKLKTTTSDYAKAIALSVAAGKPQLTQLLQANHAALVQAQVQLAAAKATGLNTQAMQIQVKALESLVAHLKTEETQLESNAKKGLTAWKQFSAGFRDEAQQNMKTMADMAKEMQQDAQQFSSDLGSEFAAAALGQESAGQAMLHGTEKLIAKMAQQWGEYFAAKAIADAFFNPAQAAAEFAASVALFTLSGVLGGLASGGGSKSSASSSSASTGAISAASTAGAQPTQTVNVPRLDGGGLVTRDTLAVVHGGEGVIPLNNRNAMRQLGAEIAAQIHMASKMNGGGNIVFEVHTDVGAQARLLSHAVDTGRVQLLASNSKRTTHR